MRKLLVLVLTITTMATVLVAVKKFHKDQPVAVAPPAGKQLPSDGGSTPLPKDKITDFTLEQSVGSIAEGDLKRDLYYLCSNELEGRMSGKLGNKLAADYIEKQYRSFGLETMRHRFRIERWNPGPKNESGDDFTENIYAWIDGTDPALKNEVVVVGAHMDHIGYGPRASQAPGRKEIHPGADDNASGTVALMAIARAFSHHKLKCKRTVVFMSFSGEEMGLIGSRYYCDNPVFPKSAPSMKSHVAMINMDMIGYLKRGTYLATFSENDSSPDLDRIIEGLNSKYSFAKSISGRGAGGSDHAPFYNKRVPVVCLHTGQHRAYHTPDDTADKINYKGLEQIARYAFELSWQSCNGGKLVFNETNFRAMTYTHDHGYGEAPFHEERK